MMIPTRDRRGLPPEGSRVAPASCATAAGRRARPCAPPGCLRWELRPLSPSGPGSLVRRRRPAAPCVFRRIHGKHCGAELVAGLHHNRSWRPAIFLKGYAFEDDLFSQVFHATPSSIAFASPELINLICFNDRLCSDDYIPIPIQDARVYRILISMISPWRKYTRATRAAARWLLRN